MNYPPYNLDESPSYKLYRTARLIRFDLNRVFQKLEPVITPEQWIVLFRLSQKDGQLQGELSKSLFHHPPNLTAMLDSLVNHRLVVRVPDTKDRRRFLIYLTHHARNFIEQTSPLVTERRRQVFDRFSSGDIEQFVGYLNQIEHNILARRKNRRFRQSPIRRIPSPELE